MRDTLLVVTLPRRPSSLGVIVERNTATRTIGRCCQGVWVAVKAVVCRLKADHAAQRRKYLSSAFSHIRVPELKVAPKAVLPILVEEDEGVDPSLQALVPVEVDVEPKEATVGSVLHAGIRYPGHQGLSYGVGMLKEGEPGFQV